MRLILTGLLCLAVILMAAPYAKAVSDHDGSIESGAIQGSEPGLSGDEEPGVYIIRLADPPLALYEGGIPGLSATRARSIGEKRLDVRSPASRAYRKHLSDRQDQAVASLKRRIDPSLTPIYRYETAFNGMALRLTPAQAAEIADLPEVVSVQRDKLRRLMTDTAPALVQAEAIWDGSGTGGLPGTEGEGVIVGIVDSGVWPEHPSFADDGTYPPPPLKWGGKCTPPADGTEGYTCTNKLIGIQFFLDAYIAQTNAYNGLFLSGRDDNGHGTYTASIAAGNKGCSASIYGIDRGTVSGMAPRAHIAAYKAVGPAGGAQADLLAAIDKAVADGVDVINYSIGSSFDSTPWDDPDALAFLAAREAGVFVTVSAGNEGPDPQTIGSPGNAPWLTTVGASYPDRLFLSNIEIWPSEPGPDSDPDSDQASEIQHFFGASPTQGISDFNLIDAEGIPDREGDRSGNCLNPFPTGTFRSTDVVLCKRGDAPALVKGNFVQDGGAGAILLYNDEESHDSNSYAYPIPAVLVSYETGMQIKERIETSESPLLISFTQGEPVFAPDPRIPTDTVAAFSSRGPSIFSWIDFELIQVITDPINVVKPDVTAPGIHVLAGTSTSYLMSANGDIGRFGNQGEFFQISQGTSMSSPHVAGLGALIRALQPDRTPTQIQSALMLTAVNENQTVRGAEGDVPATPFDAGAGRVDVSRAARAGFILDETAENFRAANPATGGEPSTLNLPGLTNAECLGKCSWKRILQSAADVPINWTLTVEGSGVRGPRGGESPPVIATPSNFILEPGETQEMTFTADVSAFPAKEWIFSDIRFTPLPVPPPENREKVPTRAGEIIPLSIPTSHFPVAIRPIAGRSPVSSLEIETRRDQGASTLRGFRAIETDTLTVSAFVGEPEFFEGGPLAQDSENDEVYDNPNDGLFIQLLPMSEDVRRFIVEITDASAEDLDLYIGRDDNNDGKPDPDEERCKSIRSVWRESCGLPDPGERLEPGNYWILIQNWEASDKGVDEFTFSVMRVDEESKVDLSGAAPIRASGPASVGLNEPFDIEISWDIPEFEINDSKEGWLEIGTDASHAGNIAAMPLTLSRIEDDVTLRTYNLGSVHPGDTLMYDMRIVSDSVQSESLTYTLIHTIPEGMTYLPGSATVEPTEIRGNQLIWIVETGHGYLMSTNSDDPFCRTPYGGYVNLADLGIKTHPDISGDNVIFRFDDFLSWNNTNPLTFFGREYPDGLRFTDDGLVLFGSGTTVSGQRQAASGKRPRESRPGRAVRAIPDTRLPNHLIAPFWQDMEIVYDEAENRGVSLGEDSGYLFVEYDGVEPAPAGSTENRLDFEVLTRRSASKAFGAYEIIFAYNAIQGDIPLNPTIGLENADGTKGVQYTGDVEDGLVICFDHVNKETVNIVYEVTIDEDIIPPGVGFSPSQRLVSTMEHAVAGGKPVITETVVMVTENPMLTVNSGDIHLTIPDQAEVSTSVGVSRKVAITDLNVFLNIRHPHPSDLSAWLVSPSGTTVTLFEHLTAKRENLTGTLLDDDAETAISDGDAPFTGSFRPAEPLNAFMGEVPEGEWTLKLYDDQPWDEGVLLSWSLDIGFASAGPAANADMAVMGENESVSIDVLANDTDGDDDPLTFVAVSTPSHGTAVYDGMNVIYTPEPGFVGEETFTYTITDNSEGMAEGEVRVTVERAGVSIIVTTLSDSIRNDGMISLREALLAAETNQSIDGSPEGGFRDTLILPPGTIRLDSEEPLTITRPLRLVGSSEGTIIEGDGSARVIHVHEDADVEIQNLTIRGRQKIVIPTPDKRRRGQASAQSQSLEVGSQRREVGSQSREARSQKLELRPQSMERRVQSSEVRSQRSEVGTPTLDRPENSELGAERLEVGTPTLDPRLENPELGAERLEVGTPTLDRPENSELGAGRLEVGTPTLDQPENPGLRAQSLESRIIGGDEAEPGDWPWMALLITRGSSPSSGRFCGGTLIHPEWVLTSGHCAVYGMENSFDVVLGLHHLTLALDAGERIQPDMALIHPDFDPVTLDSDIALIHLSVPSAQAPIDLIPPGDPVGMAEPGTSATVIGWGVTEVESETYPESLFDVSVPIVENEMATQVYEERYGIPDVITENMLAAGDEAGGKDSCTGDSGGPLVVEIPKLETRNSKLETRNTWVQAGIVSWGEGCGLPGYYGVYTRISRFTSWVYEQIGGLPPFDAYIAGGLLNQGTLVISGSTLTGNSGIKGGAIHNLGRLTLLNSTVSGNSATLGGGIFNEGHLRTIFSTIAKNEARYGGGIFNGVTGVTEIKNTLIADNSLTVAGADILGTLTTQGKNLIQESTGGNGYQSQDLLDMNPLLVPLMTNAGATLTHAIQVNGPAVDATTDCADMEGNKVETDQRGVHRQEPCDIGAFEYDERDYPPMAADDLLSTIEGPVTFDVLQNDRDANGDELVIIEFSDPENGTITTSPSSFVTYTPNAGFFGTDVFAYTLTDGTEMSEAIVTVTTLPDNLPIVQDDEALTQANTPVVIQVLSNDRDPEGNPLKVIEAAQPANGSAVTDGTGVTYSPAKNFTGTDQFMYRVTDGVKTGKAFVTVTVGDPEKCHSADYHPRDYEISLSELLRIIQIYTNGAYTCGDPGVEDGYELETRNSKLETRNSATSYSEGCTPHDSDYNPQDWRITLSELLRLVQIYNASGYHPDPEQEDGFGMGK